MQLRYSFASVCPCGFRMLKDDIPLGTMYEGDPTNRSAGGVLCGGCGDIILVTLIPVVHRHDPKLIGLMPLEIFELPIPPGGENG